MTMVLLLWVGLPTPRHQFSPPKKMIDVALISEKDLEGLGKKSKTILKNTKQKPKKKVTTQKKDPLPKKKAEVKPKAPPAKKKAPEVKKQIPKPVQKADTKPVEKKLPKLSTLKDAPEKINVKKKPEKKKEKEKEKQQEKASPVQKEEKQEPPKQVVQKSEPEKEETKKVKTPTLKEDKKPALNALLKNMETLENQAITDNKNQRRKAGITDEDRAKIKKAQVTRLADQKSRSGQVNGTLDPDEMDGLRDQISKCWNVPVGARGVEDMVAEIAIAVNHDKTVASAKLIGGVGRGFERAFRESALRAVQNPECSPLELPDGKFELWRNITFVFNARDMLGY